MLQNMASKLGKCTDATAKRVRKVMNRKTYILKK
jgi:hypothetical protein